MASKIVVGEGAGVKGRDGNKEYAILDGILHHALENSAPAAAARMHAHSPPSHNRNIPYVERATSTWRPTCS